MTHRHARPIAVAIAAVSFSTPITAQQEPTSPQTLETLGGRVSQNEQGEVVEVYLSGPKVTDASLAQHHAAPAAENLVVWCLAGEIARQSPLTLLWLRRTAEIRGIKGGEVLRSSE